MSGLLEVNPDNAGAALEDTVRALFHLQSQALKAAQAQAMKAASPASPRSKSKMAEMSKKQMISMGKSFSAKPVNERVQALHGVIRAALLANFPYET